MRAATVDEGASAEEKAAAAAVAEAALLAAEEAAARAAAAVAERGEPCGLPLRDLSGASGVTELDLSAHNPSLTVADICLVGGLLHENRVLCRVNLSGNNVGGWNGEQGAETEHDEAGIEAVCRSLQAEHSVLAVLELAEANLGARGALQLVETLRFTFVVQVS